ncbi:MAG: isocitrate/isopropylmalate family dehydrogenase [marine benthic group bacterium]|jgi:isocitrate dehydrogenase (NAD+)|nr:isocitrate/isopropylmalate family dehydrogenase [Gemmatimonadota bacterium]MCL7962584.1 isocitrate/isopropylmalate family dehydrogenase [Candidatus Carthagonibacter metallireducens]MCL7957451.1 isocitrate/isopropylmalate family dehydrogenase [Gemmatimonadota bacterium]MCL7965037.1 isocitrate/isopropylmalate family dehydrogenase [Gemmatimonadota bacterium]MCL7967109.1 isocitrate/isopropylmalate family dehydrogenase [Gemmatimonadota bacterium]
MIQTVTLIPGDGIGPAITDEVVRILDSAGAPIEWERHDAGLTAVENGHDLLPQETLDSIERNRFCLKGPLTTPIGAGFRSINVALRKHFDLYANVRPAESIVPGGRYKDIDIVIVRENTEGLYAGIEHYIGMRQDPRAVAESVMLITRYGSDRICRYAFEYAIEHKRKKVTLVHKANILKNTQGLFLEVGREVAKNYADAIEFEDRIVDATAMQLVLDPYQFDVIVTENMFGDILSDLTAGLVGGLGFAPGVNIGKDVAIFEAVHGSAPDIAGKGVANPSALLLAACLMLEHMGQKETAARIRGALKTVIHDGDTVTADLGGSASTTAFSDAVIEQIATGA